MAGTPPSPAPEFSELRFTKTRPRSDTSAFLSQNFDSASEAPPIHPAAEVSLEIYTRERYQDNLAYAQKFLMRRDISPRSEHFMLIFKEELKDAMQADTDKEKLIRAASVRIFETLIEKNAFLKAETFTRYQELQKNLLELRELQYYSRYGDYIKIIPVALRAHASANKTDNWHLLCGRFKWTEIAEKLALEEVEMKRLETEGPSALQTMKLDTRIAVSSACRDLGTSESLAIWSILEYGKRNTQMHCDFEALISKGKYQELAEVLQNDLDDIDCVFSEFHSEIDKYSLKEKISVQADKWFDRTLDPEDVALWRVRPELMAEYQKTKVGTTTPTKAQRKAMNMLENERRSEEKSSRQAANAAESSNPSASKKRMASIEYPRGSEDDRSDKKRATLVATACRLREQLERVEMELNDISGKGRP